MQNRLPLTIDPVKAAQKKLDYVGVYPTKSAERIASAVENIKSDIKCAFSFYYDAQRLCVIAVKAEVDVELLCQRCQKPYSALLTIDIAFSPVKTESQMDQLPEHYEPAILNEFGEVDMLALIEDELILNLPIAPMHDSSHCEVLETDLVFGNIPVEDEKPNPFAILASLKKKE